MKTLPEWIKEIETKRLEDERYAAKEQRQASAEYNAYVLHTDHIPKKKYEIMVIPGVQDLGPKINQWMNLLIMTKSKDLNWRSLKR